MEPSKRRLVEYAQQMYQTYADAPSKALTIGAGLEQLAQSMPMKAALSALEDAIRQRLGGNGWRDGNLVAAPGSPVTILGGRLQI